jgi:hypothetical protein
MLLFHINEMDALHHYSKKEKVGIILYTMFSSFDGSLSYWLAANNIFVKNYFVFFFQAQYVRRYKL